MHRRFSGRAARLLACLVVVSNAALAEEYFVSIGRGKGKDATKEKPAKDLGNIVAKLKDGDTVNIAEGVYVGRDETGSDTVGAAVKIVGGWADDFSKRDPWGAHRTIFTGVNAMSGSTGYRLIIKADRCAEMLVDGIVFDNGPRNHYLGEQELLISRLANAGKNLNATPESGGIKFEVPVDCSGTISNNVVMNTAPTGGAISAWGNQNSKITIRNNLVINNTGEGIFVQSKWKPRDNKGFSQFIIENNTVLFSWKHDPIASYGGNGLKLDQEVALTASGNVFAFGDYGGVDNIKLAKKLTLKDNLFTGNRLYDYREFNTSVKVSEFEDEADQLEASTDNLSAEIKVPVGEAFARLYAGRKEISRASVDAKAKAANNGANALRGMLGLPLQANAVGDDAEVWLPRLAIDDAIRAGASRFEGKYGCQKP
ncbi:MAG: right-handed parallel beta-helix repeat-containing protein [Archangium sp.]|nr:right-handed parallel beta-helix repeat-containing protein [Archangium sp.]